MAGPAEHSEIEASSCSSRHCVAPSCRRENRARAVQCSEGKFKMLL